MVEFTHSIVLFSGDDGLPLEFNVRNTNEKSLLKAMIEHGGGLCTTSKNAVHLISPGTKVLNADLGKKLVSSRYVFDCVDQNYLLEVDDYVFTISKAETSDISDEDSGKGLPGIQSPDILIENASAVYIDLSSTVEKSTHIDSSLTTPSKLSGTNQKSMTSSNQSESFVEASQDTSHNPRISGVIIEQYLDLAPLTSTAKERDSINVGDDYEDIEKDLSPIQASASLVSPLKGKFILTQEKNSLPEKHLTPHKSSPQKELFTLNRMKSLNASESTEGLEFSLNLEKGVVFNDSPEKQSSVTFPSYERISVSEESKNELPILASPLHAAVSSSQQNGEELDQFDQILLSKAQQKAPFDYDENLSQSYTVSSSADAQKPNSGEMFEGGPSTQLPDSPSQIEDQLNDYSSYLQKLKAEVEEILLKPSPKSIQDKITLVKYVCCVRKVSPASVLQSFQQI